MSTLDAAVAPARKARRPRATIGAAAVKLVEALRRGRYSDGFRSAEVLAVALERDGDAVAAANIRAAMVDDGAVMRSLPTNAPGDWTPMSGALDALVLDGERDKQFERLVIELEAVPRFIAAGIDAPTRIFFEGPSGTGKTLAAQHLAARLGMPLLVGRLDQIVDSHMGESSKKLATLFAAARTTPCVVFIDEVDGIIGNRGSKHSAADAESGRTTSSFLQQLDMLPREQIVVAASNFPGDIDGALYRRFPVRLSFVNPTVDARKKMLRYWWRNVAIGDERIETIAEQTVDVSCADLRAMAMQEARAFMLASEEQAR